MVYVSSKMVKWSNQKSILCDTVGFTSSRVSNVFTILA